MRRLTAVLIALFLGALPAFAQGEEVEIVDINASRYPEGGQTVMVIQLRNLPAAPDASDLDITVNGQPVSDLEVAPLGEGTAVPVGVALVIDASGSMSGAPIEAAKAAAKNFVSQARPEDQIALVTFADEVTVLSGFTNDLTELSNRIDTIEAEGETAFNDGVIKGVELFDAASARDLLANMIVLSDGEDTVSTATEEEALAAVSARDVRVFAVALESPDFNPEAVQQIAAAGNGLFLATPNPEELSGLYGQISREISNILVARFTSPVAAPGDAEFAVSYQGLSASTVFAVPGYVVVTTQPPGPTTTTTLAPPVTHVVAVDEPLDSSTLIQLGTAGIGITAFLLIIVLFGREPEEGGSQFVKRLQAYGRRGRQAVEEKKSLLERIPLFNRFTQAAEEEVRRRGLLSGINSALEQANIPMTPGEAVLAMMGLAAFGGVFAAIFNGALWGAITFGVLLLAFAAAVQFAGRREKRRFENQLPDTLTLMSTSLRAGYSLLQATEAVASEAPNPTAREFGRAIAESRLGRSVTDALRGIVDRTQSSDFEWVTMAIEIQREVGGNLAEVLQTVADTMRARNRLKGEIRALTAEGRISAGVLGSLPFLMFGFMWFSNRSYLQPLLDSVFGRISIVVGLLLMAAGVLWLRKIVNIKI